MSRAARSPWLLALTVAIPLGASAWYASCARTTTSLSAAAPNAMQLPAPGAEAVEGAMLLAGLDARALTAVGLAAQSAAGFVDEFRDEYATQASALDQAESRMAAARVSSDALRRKIQSGKGSPEDVTAYQAALAELTSATALKEAALAACRAPAEALLSQAQREQLARVRANEHWQLPTEFLLVDRTESQWVALRDALANEKIAPRYGEETAPQHASVLGAARAHADVALAKTRLDSNLASFKTALTAALGE